LSEYIIEVNESTFESEVILRSYDLPVVVDFWAPWCGPCKVLGPLLERLTVEAGGAFRLAKVDIDSNPGLAVRFGVQGIPAVIAFSSGEIASQFSGVRPESMVRQFLQSIAPSEVDLKLQEARGWLTARQWTEAADAFREILERNEAHSEAAFGLAKSLLMQGMFEEAHEILRRFPAGKEWTDAQKLKTLSSFALSANDVPTDETILDARCHQAARLIARQNYQAAMDGLLDILREDKQYRGGEPRQVLLAIFTLLGDDDPATRQYREELASILY